MISIAKILVVDDDPDFCKITRMVFNRWAIKLIADLLELGKVQAMSARATSPAHLDDVLRQVAVSLRQSDGELVGRVRDTGIGIPPEARDRLFTEFFRADNAKAMELRGTGLGLAIVRQVIESAGGRIWVESEPGRGSVFVFELPVAAQVAPG